MSIEEQILLIYRLAGLEPVDDEYYKKMIKAQTHSGQFQIIEIENKPVGFFGWLTKNTEDGLCIFINNFLLLNNYVGKFNFFSLRKFFRSKYENIYKVEWHNKKKDNYVEFIVKRGLK